MRPRSGLQRRGESSSIRSSRCTARFSRSAAVRSASARCVPPPAGWHAAAREIVAHWRKTGRHRSVEDNPAPVPPETARAPRLDMTTTPGKPFRRNAFLQVAVLDGLRELIVLAAGTEECLHARTVARCGFWSRSARGDTSPGPNAGATASSTRGGVAMFGVLRSRFAVRGAGCSRGSAVRRLRPRAPGADGKVKASKRSRAGGCTAPTAAGSSLCLVMEAAGRHEVEWCVRCGVKLGPTPPRPGPVRDAGRPGNGSREERRVA